MNKFYVWGFFLIIVAVAITSFFVFIGTQNKAVNLEEQIYESDSAIEVQEKRRVDLIYNLVDTVKSYNAHEKETLTKLTEARSQASEGNIDEAQLTIQAVTEAYPELKANENYHALMQELSITENLIAEYRNNYNRQIRAYNKYVRKFPNKFILDIAGYEILEAKYLEYDAPSDAPNNIFGEE